MFVKLGEYRLVLSNSVRINDVIYISAVNFLYGVHGAMHCSHAGTTIYIHTSALQQVAATRVSQYHMVC